MARGKQTKNDIYLTRAAALALELADGNVARALACFRSRLMVLSNKQQPQVTAKQLCQILQYDPETGHFKWRSGKKAGQVAGWVSGIGYHQLFINYRQYYAHRLAWLYMTGVMPTSEIDHINGDRLDNRWLNLREVTHANNVVNRGVSKTKKSGLPLGVCLKEDGRAKRYFAKLKTNGKSYFLGHFYTAEEASAAYQAKARELFGNFVRTVK
jgi:hypothetical protein